jgi:murein DD-endopeptidase MepM/ murein hydrolase activator NlpD
MHSFLRRCMCAVYSIALLASIGCSGASDETSDVGIARQETVASNGFTYPIASMSSWTAGHNYGACGSYYQSNRCHIGDDISASAGTTVSAMAAGTIILRSGTENPNCSSGWGRDWYKSSNAGTQTCNVALWVQHYDDDGQPFLALYGHLRSTTALSGGTVTSGQTLGQVAYYWVSDASPPYQGGSHLHLGFFPGTTTPPSPWGRVTCVGANQPAVPTLPALPPPCSGQENGSAPPTFMTAIGRAWIKPPQAPTLLAPSNGARVGSPVSLQWNNGSGTYRVHIMACQNAALSIGCLNPDGGGVGIEPTGTGLNRPTSYSLSVGSGTWYWSVRGIVYTDEGGWGPYGTVRSFIR